MSDYRDITELTVFINAQGKYDIMVAFETHDIDTKEFKFEVQHHKLGEVIAELLKKAGH